jgi:hypothetical protein
VGNLLHDVTQPGPDRGHDNVQESYSITSGVLEADPFAAGAYPVHLAAAVELRRTSDLFLLGHRSVLLAATRLLRAVL